MDTVVLAEIHEQNRRRREELMMKMIPSKVVVMPWTKKMKIMVTEEENEEEEREEGEIIEEEEEALQSPPPPSQPPAQDFNFNPFVAAEINSEKRMKTLEPIEASFTSRLRLKSNKRIVNKMRWYYEKKELRISPSIQAGLEQEREARYRREGARFIIDIGSHMNLSLTTMATGVVYFHRFYMFHTFQDFARYPTALACLFLAGKVEETPKKCKDMIKVAREIIGDGDEKVVSFGFGGDIHHKSEEVMTLERIILQTIKFDLHVEHPYTFLLKYAKCLKGDKTRLQKMVQMAWTFVNDSLCTTLCLQWEPEIVAIALMHLAGKLSKFEVVDWVGRNSEHYRWWDMFVDDMTIELLEDICHQVLDLYSQTQAQPQTDSPPPVNRTNSSNAVAPPLPLQPPTPTSNNAVMPPGSKGSTPNSNPPQPPLPPSAYPGGPPPPQVQPQAPFMYAGMPPGMGMSMPPGFNYPPIPPQHSAPSNVTGLRLGAPAPPPPLPTSYVPGLPPPPSHSHSQQQSFYPQPPLPSHHQPPPPPK